MKLSKRKTRRSFPAEYKAEIVRLCVETGRSPNAVAVEMGLTPSAVRNWVKQAKVDAGGGGQGALMSEERDELRALRKEMRKLRQENELLKKAAAFFAREGMS
ncbi:transposase [Haliangium ochraceum]|nr:transposase [Haliangium ochraceum]